ncbi:hypothetical protein M1N53_02720 [Thermodesulfovibrionales bacterium]|nr:hypothetical protein [Thermodesulfovibrionales bacterium]
MRSVLLDTNLLLLLIVGLYNKDLIGKHKRTKTFDVKDFDLLVEHIDGYGILWVTSHCLAEVSNLLKQTHDYQAKELMACFSTFIAKAKESHITKKVIFANNVSIRLGAADTGIVIKSKRVSCVFTTDLALYTEISKKGNKVVNFNHLRTERFIE